MKIDSDLILTSKCSQTPGIMITIPIFAEGKMIKFNQKMWLLLQNKFYHFMSIIFQTKLAHNTKNGTLGFIEAKFS